jgi:cobaltochelatase CobN
MEPELARFGPPGFERDAAIEKFIENALSGLCAAEDPLAADARELGGLLDAAELEMESLMRALSGGYVQPGIYGSPSDNGREALPTGRNIYTLDAAKIRRPFLIRPARTWRTCC